MIYTISVLDRISGQCKVVTLHADDHPSTVVEAMRQARELLQTVPTHLVAIGSGRA